MPVGQFRRWNAALDRIGPANQKGLRATGSAAHEGYIDDLRDDSSAPASSSCTSRRCRCGAGRRRVVARPARRRGRRPGEDGLLHPVLGPDARRRA